MNVHQNARLTVSCRVLLVEWIQAGRRPNIQVARELGVSVKTVDKWLSEPRLPLSSLAPLMIERRLSSAQSRRSSSSGGADIFAIARPRTGSASAKSRESSDANVLSEVTALDEPQTAVTGLQTDGGLDFLLGRGGGIILT
jgi:hypothetical protein